MIYKKLKKYVPERLCFAYIGVALAIAASAMLIISYYNLYDFLGKIIIYRDMESALPLAVKVIGFLIANTIVYFMSLWATHILAFRLETNLKLKGIEHLMSASFSFFDKNESGRVRKIIDDNTVLTHNSVAHLIPDLSGSVFTPIFGAALAFYIDYRLGILFTLSIAVGMLLIAKMMGDRKFMKQYMEAANKMNSGAVEYVRGIQVMKVFKSNMQSLKDFYRSVVDYSELALQYSMSCRRWYVFFQVVFNSAFMLVMVFFFLFDSEPTVFLTKFMFYVLYSGVIMVSFMKVMYVGMYVMQANTSIGNIENIFVEMDEKKLETGKIDAMNNYGIEFRNVSFGYADEMVIKELSLKFEQGKTYALVGSSGSGKSTIAKLISGFYTLNEGEILIGGRGVTEYSEKTLAKNIANVFQDAKLFKKTIYENVSLGRSGASREEVMEALRLAQCEEILDKFEARENTIIGSKGVHLSGGEVQRIAIARAILKNAGIVILDEASAAADPENEYELQKALSNLMKNKTVIMIAHRLSSIKGVDEVLVVDKGRIIERGNHNELIKSDTHYKKLQEEFMSANEWRVRNE